MKHTSGSPQSQQEKRKTFKARSGAVSNPGDLRMRAEERRQNAERRIEARAKFNKMLFDAVDAKLTKEGL